MAAVERYLYWHAGFLSKQAVTKQIEAETGSNRPNSRSGHMVHIG